MEENTGEVRRGERDEAFNGGKMSAAALWCGYRNGARSVVEGEGDRSVGTDPE